MADSTMNAGAQVGGEGRQARATPSPHADKTVASVFGEIVWLMSQSPQYKQYLIADLEWLVMPPILLPSRNQFQF